MDKPHLLIDLKQAGANLRELVQHVPDHIKVRLASKSIRSPELLRYFLDKLGSQACGVMCFHPGEIALLHRHGIDNLLLAYPNYTEQMADSLAIHQKKISKHQKMYLMVDLFEHMQVLSVAAERHQVTFDVVIDIDVSTSMSGLHFGVYRSSVRGYAGLEKTLEALTRFDHLHLRGTMTYEAQIAGISDRDPRENLFLAFIKRQLKRKAARNVAATRLTIQAELDRRNLLNLEIHNGGGSGSVLTTAKHVLINEITIGSGILCPALFEHYTGLNLSPAIAYALPIIRKPAPHVRTAFAGGYIASGAQGPSKQPRLLWPKGWRVTSAEGIGEVQTPLLRQSAKAPDLDYGDKVFFVPAKSGEVMERFMAIRTADLQADPPCIDLDEFQTYRGLGECFG